MKRSVHTVPPEPSHNSSIISDSAFFLPPSNVTTSSTPFIKYTSSLGIDAVARNGTVENVYTKHHCIGAMKEYENKSLEQLRLENYTLDNKLNKLRAEPSKFGQSVQQESAISLSKIESEYPPRSRKFKVAARCGKQNFGSVENDFVDKLTFKPSFSYDAPQKFKSADSRQYSGIRTIYVRDVAYGYGQLQIPDDVVIRGKESKCYAFVNFCHLDSVKAVLEDGDNIYLGKTKLTVQQSKTNAKSQWKNFKKRQGENRTDEKIYVLELQIRNVNRLKSSPSDVLHQYLLNERRSGGGEIQYFDYKQLCDRVKVEFRDQVASERVLNNKLGHQLEDVQLYVSKLTPISKKYVYLHQLPEYISKYELEAYLSRFVEKTKIVDIKFRYDNIGAIVEFENSRVIDIDQLEYLMVRSVLCDIPFDELGIRLMSVREPDSVLIVGQIPSSDALSGALEAFLLSKVTSYIDCSIRYVVEMEQSTSRCDRVYWVIFEDYRCVRFLNEKLEIGYSKVSIRKYHDYLGFITDEDEANFIRNYFESEFRLELTGLQMEYFEIGKNLESCKTWLCFNKCKFALALDSKDYKLKIVSTTEQATKKIAETIKSRLKPIVIALDDLALDFLRTNNAIFDKEIKCFFGDDYIYDIKDENLVIITSEAGRMRDTVDKFLNENIIVTENFSRNVLEYRYLEKNLTSIQSLAKGCVVKASELLQTLYAHGSLSSLKELRRNVGNFLKDARVLQLSVAKSDLSVHLRTAKGQKDVQLVEDLTGAIVSDSKACKIDFDAITPLKGCVLSGLSNNLKIFVICGSISEQMVDCIINASDNELRPIEASGIDLMKKTGDVFNRQRETHVKKYGKAKTGDAVVFEPGNLCCKKIIQAVGSWYEGSRQNEEILLRKAVTNSMQKANELNLKSVAVPDMCCKSSSYPSRKAVQIVVDSCTSFFHKSLTEIHFVHIDTRVVDLFIESLKRLPGFKLTSGSLPQNIVLPVSSINSFNDPQRNLSKPCTQPVQELMFNGCTIEIVRDSIVDVAKSVDVIVNTTGKQLSNVQDATKRDRPEIVFTVTSEDLRSCESILNGGSCSKSIVAVAGPALINDVKLKYASGFDGLDLAVTLAGRLSCKRVFHICCTDWDNLTSPDQLKRKISACLDEVEILKFNSIAFPAIGTGGLGFPVDQVAHLMIDSCKNWLESRKNPLVQKIALVIFPGDEHCVEAFDEEYSARLEIDEMPIKKVNIGKLVVDIAYGDWISEKTDALVCPVALELDTQDSKVIRALAAAIGSKKFEKLMTSCFANHKHSDNNIIAVESHMMLRASNILFVNDLWTADEDENCSQVFDELLNTADLKHFNNICIPLLSAGNFGVTVEHIYSLTSALRNFGKNTETYSSLKKVRILVHEPVIFQKVSRFLGDVKHIVSDDDRIRLSIFVDILQKSLDPLPVHTSKLTSPSEDPVRLVLYGTEKQVLEAESYLARLCYDNWSQKIIRTNIVEQLRKYEIEHLQKEARKINIDLEVYREENEFRIRGPNIESFIKSLRESLKRFVECVNCSNDCVKWYKKSYEYPDWTPVEAGLFALEMAYKCRNENLFPLRDFETEQNVTVDMKEMTVTDETGSITWTLKRKEKNDNIPLEWDWQPGDDVENIGYNLMELNENSKEYEMVRRAAFSTDPETDILKIERVENPVRYQQYALAKERVARNVAPGLPYERMLFHGTSPSHVPAICADCFDRSMAGVNGVLYGQGSYFHKDFAYSYRYGYGKTIFYCNVLTGNYCVGNSNMKTAPDFDSKRRIRFDSTVNDATNPDIFVVYSDNHAYPSYLITCN